MKISELCEAQRPRERMLRDGSGALSNAELLAVLLRTGTSAESVVELSERLLRLCGGSLVTLSERSLQELSAIKGIKGAKAVSICAAFELGRRFLSERMPLDKTPILQARQVYDLLIPLLKGRSHEECWIVLLNSSKYLLSKCQMSSGGSVSTTVDLKDILSKAIQYKAAGIILVHNHPSGNPHPSTGDFNQTEALHRASKAIDVELLDHIIICDDCYYSLCSQEVVYV